MAKAKRGKAKKAGVPAEPKAPLPVQVVEISRCEKCGSTERAPYQPHPRVLATPGIRDGKPFTHVVWRRTNCTACGQHRIDKAYECR